MRTFLFDHTPLRPTALQNPLVGPMRLGTYRDKQDGSQRINRPPIPKGTSGQVFDWTTNKTKLVPMERGGTIPMSKKPHMWDG